METLASHHRPWPDLPDPLLELIMERLPLSDYVRFSAVCRRWRSVQTSHRRGHSPSPPPMLRLPWLISSKCNQETLSCYSPFEDRSFNFPLPSCRYLDHFSRGWFMDWIMDYSSSGTEFDLFNPISGAEIHLPPLANSSFLFLFSSVITISPPPCYIVSIIGSSAIFLLRWFDSGWIKLDLPPGVKSIRKALSCAEKHYCICSVRNLRHRFYVYDLLVVDALAAPASVQYFEMKGWSQMAEETGCVWGDAYFVELDEEPLLVQEIVEGCTWVTVGFEVLRADLSRKMWVRVENIGDNRVLMLHQSWSLSLLAADIGARGNCIIFSIAENNGQTPWKMFDLGTKRLTDLLLPDASQIKNYPQQLFMPSLC